MNAPLRNKPAHDFRRSTNSGIRLIREKICKATNFINSGCTVVLMYACYSYVFLFLRLSYACRTDVNFPFFFFWFFSAFFGLFYV